MRRSFEGLGGEPWTRRTWCSDISPGCSSIVDRLALVDLDRDLLAAGQQVVLGEGVAVRDLVGCVRAGDEPIAPFASLLGVSATQAVTTSGRLRPQ